LNAIAQRKTPTPFSSVWVPDLEKKLKFQKYKNRVELEFKKDDLYLLV
jgi:hypothetical protein